MKRTHPPQLKEKTAAEKQAIAVARAERKEKRTHRGDGIISKHDPDLRRYYMVLAYDGPNFHGWQKQGKIGEPSSLRTVAGVLEEYLRPLLSQRVKFWPSGRTDAGVSATGQVASFDAILPEGAHLSLAAECNAALPTDVRVLSVSPTHRGFLANNCMWKRYVYRVDGGPLTTYAQCVRFFGDGRDSKAGDASSLVHSAAPGENSRGESSQRCALVLDAHSNLLDAASCSITNSPCDPPSMPPVASLSMSPTLDLAEMQVAAKQLLGCHDFASFQSKGGPDPATC